ncbi:MAG: Ig-like domain-containing protein [Deltaproteobacteria bacterium]|nr:Ig-like domain-containing protein [Deltaproteobacteria bacterium]
MRFKIYIPILILFFCSVALADAIDPGYRWNKAQPLYILSDRSVPVVSILAPKENARVGGVVMIKGTASDPSGIYNLEVQMDDGVFQPARGNLTAWQFPLDTQSLSNGVHILKARASNVGGNFSAAQLTLFVYNEK